MSDVPQGARPMSPDREKALRGARVIPARAWTWAMIFGALLPGAALRIFRLGRWPLEGDELPTLRDSIVMHWSNARPLIFALNHYLVRPALGLDELSLRLLPMLFGVAAIPVLYFLLRRALSASSGLYASVLLAFSAWHVYASQFARYYSLEVLLCAIFPLAAFVGVRERNVKWLWGAAAAALLAILAHPSTMPAVLGVVLWLLYVLRVEYWRHVRRWLGRLSGPYRFLAMALVLGAVTVVAIRAYRILSGWSGEGGQGWGHGPLALILSYGAWVTPVVMVFAAAGVVLLWSGVGRDRTNRDFAVLVLCGVGVPFLVLCTAAAMVAVSTSYLFSTLPLVFVAAACFVESVVGSLVTRTRRVAAGGALVLAGLVANAPSLASQYLDGGRPDFRSAAEYIQSHAGPSDAVVSDQPEPLNHYDSAAESIVFSRSDHQLDSLARVVRSSAPSGNVWIVEERRQRGGFNEMSLGAVTRRVRSRCTLELSKGVARLDFRQNAVRVYRCPAEALLAGEP